MFRDYSLTTFHIFQSKTIHPVSTASLPVSPAIPKQTQPYVPVGPNTAKKFQQLHGIATPQRDFELPESESPNSHRACARNYKISQEEMVKIDERISKPPPYSKSILKQTKFTADVYKNYCTQRKLTMYPVTAKVAEGFVVWLARTGHYATTTLETVILQSLSRLNRQHTGTAIPYETRHTIILRIKELRRDPTVKKPTGGDEAIILDDIYRMITSMDPRDQRTPAIASLLLFSISTAARGSSCSEVTIGDIRSLKNMTDGSVMVTIAIKKLKQHPLEKIELSLSGYLPSENPLDFIGWLDKHITILTGRGLRQIVAEKLDEKTKQTLLWPYSTESMTAMVKRRMRWAGLPKEKMGMHSLRQGFLSVAKTYQEAKGTGNQSIMEQAAMYAVWTPFGKVQYGYIKDVTRRTKSTTNFIGLTNTVEKSREASFVPDGETSPHLNSLDFHLCDLVPYEKQRRMYSSAVYQPLRKLLWHPDASSEANEKYIRNNFNWSLVNLAKTELERAKVDDKANQDLQELLEAHHAKCSEFCYYPALRKLGCWILDARTLAQPDQCSKIAEELFEELKSHGRILDKLPTCSPRQDQIDLSGVPRVLRRDGSMAVKRREWTTAENRIFLDCIRKGASVREMEKKLGTRTASHIFDHIRALNIRLEKKHKQKVSMRKAACEERAAGGGAVVSSSDLIDEHPLIGDLTDTDSLSESSPSEQQEPPPVYTVTPQSGTKIRITRRRQPVVESEFPSKQSPHPITPVVTKHTTPSSQEQPPPITPVVTKHTTPPVLHSQRILSVPTPVYSEASTPNNPTDVNQPHSSPLDEYPLSVSAPELPDSPPPPQNNHYQPVPSCPLQTPMYSPPVMFPIYSQHFPSFFEPAPNLNYMDCTKTPPPLPFYNPFPDYNLGAPCPPLYPTQFITSRFNTTIPSEDSFVDKETIRKRKK